MNLDDESVFSFDDTDMAEDTGGSDFLGGAFGNLVFGGALDIRRITRGQDLVPEPLIGIPVPRLSM